MVFVPPKDRVFERSTSNSQSVFTVTGAADTSYNAFSASMSVADTTLGAVVEAGVAFKVGLLTYSATNEVTVTTVYDSKGTFSSGGVKEVFMSLPSRDAILVDGVMALTSGQQKQARENIGASIGIPDVIIEDQKTAGTAGGGLTGGSNTRTLNTLVRNNGTIASLSSNQFTLGAGSYFIAWSAPAWQVNQHQSILRNVTDSANAAIGTSEYAPSATDSTQSRSIGSVFVTIAGSKAFAIFHSATSTKATNGGGLAANLGSTEIYSRVEITKLN